MGHVFLQCSQNIRRSHDGLGQYLSLSLSFSLCVSVANNVYSYSSPYAVAQAKERSMNVYVPGSRAT